MNRKLKTNDALVILAPSREASLHAKEFARVSIICCVSQYWLGVTVQRGMCEL